MTGHAVTNRFHRSDPGVRRFLEDLRSGFDRRSGADRRKSDAPDVSEGAERRGYGRRSADRHGGTGDRRRPLGAAFGPGDCEHLAAILADEHRPADCPRCGGPLLRSEGLRAGGPLLVIICTGCRHYAEMT